jgi:hypothetical protein
MPKDGPLSPEDREELARANNRAKKIFGAAKIAAFNGWIIGGLAAVALLFAPFSMTAFFMGVGMAVVAWNEFHGRKLLREFDPQGARLLGRNQLGFVGLVSAYCLWSIYRTLTQPIAGLDQLDAIAGSVSDLVTNLTVTVYVVVMLASLLVQGLNARYYFARTKMVQEYLNDTPDWIVDLQRSTSL